MRTMTSERRKNPKPFTPVKGEVYTNGNGAKYLCEADGHQDEDGRSIAWMTNIKSGWSMTTKGIVMYDNGEIEWDYSTDGTFLPIDDERQAFRALCHQGAERLSGIVGPVNGVGQVDHQRFLVADQQVDVRAVVEMG